MSKNNHTIMLMGEPSCGKTAYISLALGYMQSCGSDDYRMMPAHALSKSQRDDSCQHADIYTMELPDGMRKGLWPVKTLVTEYFKICVKHKPGIPALAPPSPQSAETQPQKMNSFFENLLLVISAPLRGPVALSLAAWEAIQGVDEDFIHFYDCTGEAFRKQPAPEQEEGEQDEDYAERLTRFETKEKEKLEHLQQRCCNTDYFLLFVDCTKLRHTDDTTRHALRSASLLLGHRVEQGAARKASVAVIFTKSDRWQGKNKLAEMEAEFRENYISRLPEMEYNTEYKFFSVSCVPNPEHTTRDEKKNIIANAEWRLSDMQEQLAPLRWISRKFS